MENDMEIPVIVLFWGYIGIMKNRNYYNGVIHGLYRDNGQ